MKTKPVPQAIQINQHQLDLLRQAIFLMLMSLLAITVFAGEIPAPISNLSSFSASVHQQKAVLQWSVNDEKAISHYTVERSTNGNEYTDIATVFTGETPSAIQQYNFQENIPAATGNVYYRLKMVGANGSITYSEIRVIKPNLQTADYLLNMNPGMATAPANWVEKFVSLSSLKQNGQSVNVLMINNSIASRSVVVK